MEGEARGLVDDAGAREGEEQVRGLVRGSFDVGEAGDGVGQGVEGGGPVDDAVLGREVADEGGDAGWLGARWQPPSTATPTR